MEKRYHEKSYEIDEDYFLWLCQLVGADDPNYGYLGVLRTLYDTEFSDRTAKFIPNDQNRVCDALKLRDKFVEQSLYDDYYGVFNNPCSALEILISLAYRMADQMCFEDQGYWFWEMMHNMGLDEFDDCAYFTPMGQDKVYHILRNWRVRRYAKDGRGGPFPLKHPEEDQRKVEIWYQMNAYLIEQCM